MGLQDWWSCGCGCVHRKLETRPRAEAKIKNCEAEELRKVSARGRTHRSLLTSAFTVSDYGSFVLDFFFLFTLLYFILSGTVRSFVSFHAAVVCTSTVTVTLFQISVVSSPLVSNLFVCLFSFSYLSYLTLFCPFRTRFFEPKRICVSLHHVYERSFSPSEDGEACSTFEPSKLEVGIA